MSFKMKNVIMTREIEEKCFQVPPKTSRITPGYVVGVSWGPYM